MRTFEDLWTDYLEGDLDEGGVAELEALFAADPELARRAADLYAEHRALGLLHSGGEAGEFARSTLLRIREEREGFVSSVTDQVRVAVPPPAKRRWRDYAVVAAATILFTLVLQFILAPRPKPTEASPAVPVATLVRSDRAHWEPEGALLEGQRLLPGSLRLSGGQAVLLFDGGAVVALHGPADVEVVSRGSVRIRHGRITVHADQDAVGFTVHTPAGEAVDQGTEFVVSVELSGATEIHVQQGEVAWSREAGHPPSRTLKAGQAVRFESAHGSEGREITFASQSLEDILRQRSVEMIPVRPTAQEDFDYGAGEIAVSDAGGGFGWKGPWRLRRGMEVTKEADQSALMRIAPESLQGSWLPLPERGGALSLPPGPTFLIRELKEPIDLRREAVYYLSFLVRREADASPGSSEVPQFRLTLRSSQDYWGGCIAASLPLSRRPTIQFHSRDSFTSPSDVDLGSATLWVLKIVSSPTHPDEVFLKVFKSAEPLPRFEPSQWSIVTGPLLSDGRLDLVVVTSTGPATHVFDGLRVGRTWESVVRRD